MALEEDKWQQTITVAEAYRTMQELVFIYYKTGRELDDQIAMFGSALAGDPALEDDWFDALKKVRQADADQRSGD